MTIRLLTNYAIPPGATLQEALDDRNLTRAELARRMGRPLRTVNRIVKGRYAITPDMARQLEKILSIPATLWIRLEQNYQDDLARLRRPRNWR